MEVAPLPGGLPMHPRWGSTSLPRFCDTQHLFLWLWGSGLHWKSASATELVWERQRVWALSMVRAFGMGWGTRLM